MPACSALWQLTSCAAEDMAKSNWCVYHRT